MQDNSVSMQTPTFLKCTKKPYNQILEIFCIIKKYPVLNGTHFFIRIPFF